MKRLCIVLVCLALPLQLGARTPNHPQQLVYDFCGPALLEEGWVILCEIRGFGTASPIWGTNPEWSVDGTRIAGSSGSLTIYNADGSSTVLSKCAATSRSSAEPGESSRASHKPSCVDAAAVARSRSATALTNASASAPIVSALSRVLHRSPSRAIRSPSHLRGARRSRRTLASLAPYARRFARWH